MPHTIAHFFFHSLAASPRTRFRLTDLADRVLTWMEVARQRRHLAALDNRMLSDIGFSLADVDREIDRPFWDVESRAR